MMPKRSTTVAQGKTKQLQSRASPLCLLLLIFLSETPIPPSVLRASVCVTQPLVLLPPRRFYVTLNTNAGTSWGCQLAACFCSLLSVVHLFIEKNKITASWPAGPGRPACVRFVLFFSNGWFTMMKSFLAHFTSKSYLVVGIQGFECLLRVFPLRKQLCNSCLEHILTNCFLFSPPNPFFFSPLSEVARGVSSYAALLESSIMSGPANLNWPPHF